MNFIVEYFLISSFISRCTHQQNHLARRTRRYSCTRSSTCRSMTNQNLWTNLFFRVTCGLHISTQAALFDCVPDWVSLWPTTVLVKADFCLCKILHAKYASNTTKKPTTNSSSNRVKIGICKQRGNQRPVLAAHSVYLSPKSDAIFSSSEDTTTFSSHNSHGKRKASSHLELNMTARPNSCSVAERYIGCCDHWYGPVVTNTVVCNVGSGFVPASLIAWLALRATKT